jgi:hypothetical protein
MGDTTALREPSCSLGTVAKTAVEPHLEPIQVIAGDHPPPILSATAGLLNPGTLADAHQSR